VNETYVLDASAVFACFRRKKGRARARRCRMQLGAVIFRSRRQTVERDRRGDGRQLIDKLQLRCFHSTESGRRAGSLVNHTEARPFVGDRACLALHAGPKARRTLDCGELEEIRGARKVETLR